MPFINGYYLDVVAHQFIGQDIVYGLPAGIGHIPFAEASPLFGEHQCYIASFGPAVVEVAILRVAIVFEDVFAL